MKSIHAAPRASRPRRRLIVRGKIGDAGFAETLGVGHDVCLRDRDEVGGTEELADLDLVLDGDLRHAAELAGAAVEESREAGAREQRLRDRCDAAEEHRARGDAEQRRGEDEAARVLR